MNVSDGDHIVSVAIVSREVEDDDGDFELSATSTIDQIDEDSSAVESEE